VLSFAFWPYASYNPFWFYGPNFILDTVFWPSPYGGYGYARPYGGYGYARPYDVYSYGGYAYPPNHHRRVAPGTTPSPSPLPTEACTGLAPGVTDLPTDQIARAVHPTGDQIAALDELKAASAKAADVLNASCPTEVPLTPVARLDALEKRLNSMLQAVQIVHDPLHTFYNSLSDEQKQQFEKIGGGTAKESTANELSSLCSEESTNFTQLPTQAIEQSLEVDSQQEPELDQLSTASSRSATELEKSCPTETPQNPADRLDAITKRLNAMIQAVNTIRPALNNFYTSLSDDQKARFNVMQQPATARSQ
jgi:LTXXQ motif family protein